MQIYCGQCGRDVTDCIGEDLVELREMGFAETVQYYKPAEYYARMQAVKRKAEMSRAAARATIKDRAELLSRLRQIEWEHSQDWCGIPNRNKTVHFIWRFCPSKIEQQKEVPSCIVKWKELRLKRGWSPGKPYRIEKDPIAYKEFNPSPEDENRSFVMSIKRPIFKK